MFGCVLCVYLMVYQLSSRHRLRLMLWEIHLKKYYRNFAPRGTVAHAFGLSC